MHVAHAAPARSIACGAPGLPPRLAPELFRDLAASASLAGGDHETMPVVAPFTGKPFAEVWLGGPADVAYAVERARRAQPAWAARPLAERAAVLLRYHDLVMARAQETMDLVQLESGKARIDAFFETMDVAMVARHYAVHGPRQLRRHRRPAFPPLLAQTTVGYHPKGVVGVIAPWNYPLTMAITDALPALLAGNAVVVKPAEQTPLSALWAARLLYEAGLPPEVLHVVPGRGEEVGPALVDAVDFVQFTGSTAVGRTVAERAGARLIGASLELGGKNPLVVRHDADLGLTIPGVLQAAFSCAGQLCISAERIYVQERLFDRFVERLRAAVRGLVVNARYDFSAHVGSLASQAQLEKVTHHVEDARAQGAEVVVGGHALPEIGPFFYAPTVLTGVRPGMAVHREETFGPVVAVYPYGTDEEAVALANDSEYGLNASVWTRDLRAGRRLAERIRCGTVGVNDAFVGTWGSTGAPMGGFGASGLGRRHGPEGLLKFTEPQTVTTQLLAPLAPLALGIEQARFAALTQQALRLLRYVPGLR